MSKKYFVYLENDRKVGPFTKEQIGILYLKGHVKGTEQCEVFPHQEKIQLNKIKEIVELIKEIISKKLKPTDLEVPDSDLTAVKLSLSALKKETLKERERKDEIDRAKKEKKELEEKFANVDMDQFKLKNQIKEADKESESESEGSNVRNDNNEDDEEDDDVIPDMERTQINPLPWPAGHTEDGVQKGINLEETEEDLQEEEQEEPEEEYLPVSTNDATEVVNLESLLPDIHYDAKGTEESLEEKEERIRVESKIERKKIRSEIKKLKDEGLEEPEEKKKKMSLVVVLAFLVVIFFALEEDDTDKKGITPIYAKLSFPIPADYKNEIQSETHLKKGKEFLKKKVYTNKILAADQFKQSIVHNFKNHESFGLLILSYAEIFENVQSRSAAIATLYRLIKQAETSILANPDVALGAAIFYMKNNKFKTARKVIENYVGASKKPTVKMFAVYLHVLTKISEWEEADKIYLKIKDIKNAPVELYVYIADYLIHKPGEETSEEKNIEVLELLKSGLKRHPDSVWILTEMAPLTLRSGNIKDFKKIIYRIKELGAEKAPSYYSKYLEFLGMANAFNDKPKVAAKYFKQAVKVFPSSELRSRLAKLEVGGSKQVENLILESKIIKMMEEVKLLIRKGQLDKAFYLMIDAVDLDESYIPSKILLSKIEIDRGYYLSALKTLEELRDDHSDDAKIIYELALAYIESFKLDQAKKIIDQVSNSKFSSTAYYAALLGRYYLKTGRVPDAFSWLFKSVVRNPLDDEGYYILALNYFKYRKYKKAKENLLVAMGLDPDNLDYKSLYAEILYELSGAGVAIGFLREELKKEPESAKILGDIAIYYYRSGQIKEFETYKSKLATLDTSDKDFYKFLISAAQIEEDMEKVIKYSNALIKISPGDLGSRMVLGKYLIEKGKLLAGENLLLEVRQRLPSYPKVNYYLTQISIQKKNFKEAHEYASDEIKYNKSLEHGPYIKGEVYRLEGKINDAIKQYEIALSINGNYIDALNALAYIKRGQNYLDTARELYLRVLKVEKGNIVANRNLAHVYKDIGQSKLALEQYKVYLKLNPNGKDVDNIRNIMRGLR